MVEWLELQTEGNSCQKVSCLDQGNLVKSFLAR